MFEVTVDHAASRVEILLAGEYDFEPDDFHKAVKQGVAQAKAPDGTFDLLVDMAQIAVMPGERTETGQEIILWAAQNGLRKGAFAVSAVLLEMQLKRMAERDERMRYFASRAEAQSWLEA